MIADVTVRLARIADAAEIAVMSRDYIERGLPWTWNQDRVARAIVDLETNVAVVGEPGSLTAFGIMFHTAEDAHLLLFAVHSAHQRKGVGSAVLRWLEEVARNAGAKKIRVECLSKNQPARLFYSEHGYHELAITKQMYRGVADGIHLEKWLRVEGS
jgi:[ribosomal protein S18]-alanine N-acetyltransferase